MKLVLRRPRLQPGNLLRRLVRHPRQKTTKEQRKLALVSGAFIAPSVIGTLLFFVLLADLAFLAVVRLAWGAFAKRR